MLRRVSVLCTLAACSSSAPMGSGDAGDGDASLADGSSLSDGAADSPGADAAPSDAMPGGDSGGPSSTPAIRATTGWQVYPGGGYHYGPSIIIDASKTIHMWTCSPGANGAWDYVRYHASTDGGHTWSPDVVALQPTPSSLDAYSTCDPGAVRIGAYWFVGYTSTTNPNGTQNAVFLARATSPTGPFDKWNGAGWGGNPKPVVPYGGSAAYYGFGEPSLVLMGKKLFLYYSDDQAVQYTDVQTVDDATADDWPAHLVDHGHAIPRTRSGQDSADVKYVDSLSLFLAVTTYDRFTSNSTVAVYQSPDGLTFVPAPFVGARVQVGAHNIGISGDPSGHLETAESNFIAYAYQPLGNGWGDWPTFLDPITVTAAPPGTPVGGGVSSIVGGNDWNWSGPRAWDGDPATVFSSDSHGATDTANEWATVDLGASYGVTGVTVVPRAAGYGFPVDFAIQSSPDGSAWTDVAGQGHTAFANPGSTPVKLTFGASVTARYLRVYATRLGPDNAGNHYLQLAEIVPQVAP
jgi:hypothetical protein